MLRDWGSVTATPSGGASGQTGAPPAHFVWAPPAELASELPPGFSFALRCVVGGDGARRFFPAAGLEHLVTTAFAGGLALLSALKRHTPEQRDSYRFMWQVFRRVRLTREHFGNQFGSAGSLAVRRSARAGAARETVLPETVGQTAGGEGDPRTPERLLREGEAEARRQGIYNPDESEQVRYGLLCAARRDPLPVEDAGEVEGLVRFALYEAVPEGDRTVPGVNELILGRLLLAVPPHLADSNEAFDGWLLGANNSLVAQLAKQKRAEGGPLERDVVRRALQDLGWEAYRYVADCVHTMLHVFRRLVVPALTERERGLFDHMHLKQPHFGNLPFALLAERIPLLLPVLEEVWGNPADRQTIGVMHRLLAYYGEMASQRRALDRHAQAACAGGAHAGKTAVTVSYSESDDLDAAALTSPWPGKLARAATTGWGWLRSGCGSVTGSAAPVRNPSGTSGSSCRRGPKPSGPCTTSAGAAATKRPAGRP